VTGSLSVCSTQYITHRGAFRENLPTITLHCIPSLILVALHGIVNAAVKALLNKQIEKASWLWVRH
jgi:hypothetical protein